MIERRLARNEEMWVSPSRFPLSRARSAVAACPVKAFGGQRVRLRSASFRLRTACYDETGRRDSLRPPCAWRRLAEREGFEPPGPFGPAVFKTAAIDHSATSPGAPDSYAQNWGADLPEQTNIFARKFILRRVLTLPIARCDGTVAACFQVTRTSKERERRRWIRERAKRAFASRFSLRRAS